MKIKLFIFCLLISEVVFCQKRTIYYDLSLSGYVSQEEHLPFWSVTNQNGIVPESNGGLLKIGIFSDFNPKHKIQFSYGVSTAGLLSKSNNNLLLDELYISSKWEKIRLDLGMIHPDIEYGGISSTNGNIVHSTNVRTMPGYNLRTDFITVPWTRQILSFKFNWADYMMIDNRFAHHTKLHNKSFFVKLSPLKRLELIVGLEHWAQWSGKSPVLGQQPSSFKDYLRIVAALEGGEGASQSDIINVLGNHLGAEHLRINLHANKFSLSFYYDIPFEDHSGLDFYNAPDATYGIYFNSKNRKQWITDAIYELTYTKCQSGPLHDRPATPEEMAKQDPDKWYYGKIILGGNDNYFNNGEYRSGWTYYGKTIGTPFITPCAPNEKGQVLGVYNNRVLAHHWGIKGLAFLKIPYKALFSYSRNYGTFSIPFEHPCEQYSFAIELKVPEIKNLPFNIDFGVYGDYGKLFKNNLGFNLKISRKAKLIALK